MNKTMFLILFLASSAVFADVNMKFSDGSFVMINDHYVAVGDQDGHAIFEAGKETFITVDHEEQTYTEISKTFAEDMAAMMKAQMEQMLADVPPEQRAMFEQSMKGMLPGRGAIPELPKMTVKKTGRQDTVAGYTCSEIEVSYGSGQREELSCVATAGELGISNQDYQSMTAAMRSISRMVGMNGDDDSMMDLNAMGGIPIRTRGLEFGDEDELVSLSKDDIGNDEFAIPPGYNKLSMKDMMMQ